VIIPTTFPLTITGILPIFFSTIIFSISSREVSGVTKINFSIIKSFTLKFVNPKSSTLEISDLVTIPIIFPFFVTGSPEKLNLNIIFFASSRLLSISIVFTGVLIISFA